MLAFQIHKLGFKGVRTFFLEIQVIQGYIRKCMKILEESAIVM